MRISTLFFGIILIAGLCSCGDEEGEGGPGLRTSTQRYTYSVTFNDCKTGSRTFGSVEALCDGLRQDSRKACAGRIFRDMLQRYFDSHNCAGGLN